MEFPLRALEELSREEVALELSQGDPLESFLNALSHRGRDQFPNHFLSSR